MPEICRPIAYRDIPEFPGAWLIASSTTHQTLHHDTLVTSCQVSVKVGSVSVILFSELVKPLSVFQHRSLASWSSR
jgi:hypothetical protein